MPLASPPWTPCLPGKPGLVAALDSLMWIVQVEYNGFSTNLQIRGYVKLVRECSTEGEMLHALADSLEDILDVLDQAGTELTGYPEVTIRNECGVPEMQVCLTIRDIT